MATIEARVTKLERCDAARGDLLDALVDKVTDINVKQIKVLSILENGLSQKMARAIYEFHREEQEKANEAQQKVIAADREERRLQLEEQKAAAAMIGQRKDRINRLLIATIPIITVGITLLINKLFGG